MSGFTPTTPLENAELAATCTMSLREHGPMAKVAVRESGYMAERLASSVLADCWERRNKFDAHPPPVPDTGLKEALRQCVAVMEMQEQRATGEFHISAVAFWPIWNRAKDLAKAAIARLR